MRILHTKGPSDNLEVRNPDNGFYIFGTMMPGQCGTMVLHAFNHKTCEEILPLLESAEKVAAQWGYTHLYATVTHTQEGALAALQKCNWLMMESYNNARTGNNVKCYAKRTFNPTLNVHFGGH